MATPTPSPTEVAEGIAAVDWSGIPAWLPVILAAVIAASAAIITARVASTTSLRARYVDILREDHLAARDLQGRMMQAVAELNTAMAQFLIYVERQVRADAQKVAAEAEPGATPRLPEVVITEADRARVQEATVQWRVVHAEGITHGDSGLSTAMSNYEIARDRSAALVNAGKFGEAEDLAEEMRGGLTPLVFGNMALVVVNLYGLTIRALSTRTPRAHLRIWTRDLHGTMSELHADVEKMDAARRRL